MTHNFGKNRDIQPDLQSGLETEIMGMNSLFDPLRCNAGVPKATKEQTVCCFHSLFPISG